MAILSSKFTNDTINWSNGIVKNFDDPQFQEDSLCTILPSHKIQVFDCLARELLISNWITSFVSLPHSQYEFPVPWSLGVPFFFSLNIVRYSLCHIHISLSANFFLILFIFHLVTPNGKLKDLFIFIVRSKPKHAFKHHSHRIITQGSLLLHTLFFLSFYLVWVFVL